jgi:CheY-like chemotaxis protein
MPKVLLVEDDNNLREIYEARLQAEGYTIVSAKDGEEALVVAKEESPDLIISDVMMPKISGFEMLDILRNTPGMKETKVIMLTALGQAEDQTRANKLGADRYLVKSQVTLEDIVRVSHELLGDDSQEPATEENTAETALSGASPQAILSETPVTPAPSVQPQPSVPAPEPALTDLPQPPIQPVTPVMPASTNPVADNSPAATADPVNSTLLATAQAAAAPSVQPQPVTPVMPPAEVPITMAGQQQPFEPVKSGSETDLPGVSYANSGPVTPNISDVTSPPVAASATIPTVQQNTPPASAGLPSEISINADGILVPTEAEESATMDKRINDFLNNTPNTVPAVTQATTTSNNTNVANQTANDQTLAQAVNNLMSGNDPSDDTSMPGGIVQPEPTAATATTVDPNIVSPSDINQNKVPQPVSNSSIISGKKIIQPPAPQPQKNIELLAAQEEAAENYTQTSNTNPYQEESSSGPNNPIDPNSIAL